MLKSDDFVLYARINHSLIERYLGSVKSMVIAVTMPGIPFGIPPF